MLTYFRILIVTMAVVMAGCCSVQGVTRCAGQVVQVCDPSHRWMPVANCDDLDGWRCGEDDDTHTCFEEFNADQ